MSPRMWTALCAVAGLGLFLTLSAGATPDRGRTSEAGRPVGTLVLACSGCPGAGERSSLYTLTPGGRLRRIPGTEAGVEPSWSPDGRFVAYSAGSYELRVVAEDGTRSRRLAGRPYPAPQIGASDWSPDGRSIVFVRYEPQPVGSYRGSLWRIPAAGGRARLVHAPRYSTHDPSWSPDGRWIAYGDSRQRLWAISAGGGGQRPLGSIALRGESPRWSPDGRRLAFVQAGRTRALSVLELDTGRVRRVVGLAQPSQIFSHTWSPDGRWLALARQREYACDEVPPPRLCVDFEVLAIRVRDRASRVMFRADYGEPYGIGWRR